MKKLYGVTTAMVTPFDEQGRVMTESVQQMVEFLIERGVHCLYPCGTTGEMFLMPEVERRRMAETVVRQNRGRITAYVHVGAMDPDETIRLAKHACEIGADGIGVVTPAFFGTHSEAMVQYYERVCRSVPEDFPVYLYNIPQCAANDLNCDVIRRILDRCRNVVGMKYSFADMIRTSEYLLLSNSFEVVQGADRLMLPALAMGCTGIVSGVSSVYPEPFVKVYEAFQEGDIPAARCWQELANRYVVALGAGSNMAIFKSGLKYRGIYAGHMHAPQINCTPEQEASLSKMLAALDAQCPKNLLKTIEVL